MKKGFTLIELLATIVIIGVVALIAVPSVINNIAASREKLYTTQVQNIELATKKWATASIEELDSTYLNSSFVSVEMLQDLGYLSKEKMKNPMTSEIMEGCVEVAYHSESKIYTYTYDDENVKCLTRDKKGYYYQKNENNVWEKDTTNETVSIFSYLVGTDNSNIVTTGSGLYDMEDRYVFRGNITNNYVKIDNSYFRILSLDKTTKTIKIVSATSNGSAVWGATSNSSFNSSTLYTTLLDNELYRSIINTNVKWNIGKIENTNNLNLNAIRTYETKTKIESNIGLISMSEYMEASINGDCSSGILTSCALDTYLDMADAWTLTTTDSYVAYIDTSKGLSYETDLVNSHHNIYRTLNVVATEKNGSGTYADPFVITLES